MHELALTQTIVEMVAAHAQGRTVKRVTLEVGKLTCVMPDALRFCFDLVAAGTSLDGACLDICEIEVDRSDSKGFVMLTFDTTPNYTDTTPFPSTPTKWTYRAIYRVGDQRVGQWSKPVSVTVGG